MEARIEQEQDAPEGVELPTPIRNMERVQEGVRAFRRDLDGFLKAKKLHHFVAYEAGKQVAEAPTHRKLNRKLDKIESLKRSDLFVACITPPDRDDEFVPSR